jgi:DDE superfamily endonuclease
VLGFLRPTNLSIFHGELDGKGTVRALASRGIARLDRAYAEHRQIRLVLDNHSAHISKETHGHLHSMPQRLVFVFTPTRGSWLNLIESQFSPGRVSLEVQDG